MKRSIKIQNQKCFITYKNVIFVKLKNIHNRYLITNYKLNRFDIICKKYKFYKVQAHNNP